MSAGIALPGDVSAELRSADPPVVARVRGGRTVYDLCRPARACHAHRVQVIRALPPGG